MQHLFTKLALPLVLTSVAVVAQTPAEKTAIEQRVHKIQNYSASILAVLGSTTMPANWKDIATADLNAIKAEADLSNQMVFSVNTTSVTVPAGANLQTYLDNAMPGDTLVLQAGATYTGNFVLRPKQGEAWITITGSNMAQLPGPGQRVRPSDAPLMPKIMSPNLNAALVAAPGSHHYRIVGVEIATAPGVYNGGLLRIGTGEEASLAALPRAFEIDRVYIHGDPIVGSKRGIALNGIDNVVRNSWISEFKSTDQDTQAICAWNGPGPYVIENNYLEAAGENVFLAEGSLIPGVHPTNVKILRNHITRPLAWRTAKAPNGYPWVVKNLVELKSGKQVLIQGNIIENNWKAGQVGYAINLKAGGAAKATPALTDGVIITNNIIRGATGAVTIQGDNGEGGHARNITITNNLFDDMNVGWGISVYLFAMVPNTSGVVIENNTATATVAPKGIVAPEGAPATGFVFRSNILPTGTYGIKGSGYGAGSATLNYYWPSHMFYGNVFFDSTENPALYPAGTYFTATYAAVGLSATYSMPTTSVYYGKGWNGSNPGANYTTIAAETATVVSGGR